MQACYEPQPMGVSALEEMESLKQRMLIWSGQELGILGSQMRLYL